MQINQHTIKESGSLSGIGLHTGNKCKITFVPAPVGYGHKFVRTDLDDSPEIPALIDHVADVKRGTTLGVKGVMIHTVEHVLSAMAGLQIDNARVEITADEPPVLDGSALPFVKLMRELGSEEQNERRTYLDIDETIIYHNESEGTDLVVLPSDKFQVTYMIDYQNSAIGTQYTSLYDLEKEYESEFAAARTFCFLSELEELYDSGLARGGSLDCALIYVDHELSRDQIDQLRAKFQVTADVDIRGAGMLFNTEARFPNEPARHKVVDLIGDLALLGMPVKGHVMAARAGHAAHIELVKLLYKESQKRQLQQRYQTTASDKFVFDAEAIQRILPHRYPFLLVDRIIELVPGEKLVALKNVSMGDHFFQGHFPSRPIMPGVLVVEALGQAGGVLLLNTAANPDDKLVYFTGLNEVKFRKPVLPGDQLILKVEMNYYRRGICKMRGQAFVGDSLVAEAEMQAVVVDRKP